MRINRTKKVVAVAAAAGVLALGIIVPALAQGSGSDPGTTGSDDTTTGSDGSTGSRYDRRGDRHQEFVAALAAELGIDADTVADAIDAVRDQLRAEHDADRRAALEDRLDDAVEDGQLSQDQADAIREAEEAGVQLFGGGGDHGRHHGGFGGGHGPMHLRGDDDSAA